MVCLLVFFFNDIDFYLSEVKEQRLDYSLNKASCSKPNL